MIGQGILLLPILFLAYGVLGWIADTSYRSLRSGRLQEGSAFGIPFCPIYAFGALILIWFGPFLMELPLVVEGLMYGVVLSSFEYVGGVFSERTFKVRFWDYSHRRFHLHGHTDLEHFFLWVIGGMAFVHLIHPYVLSIVS